MQNVKSDFLRVMMERGFFHQATDLEGLDEQFSAETVSAYLGFDLTAKSFHVGNLVQIMRLFWLQETGHRPIVLMGGGTTRVGDPSGRDESRKLLTLEDIEDNKRGIQQVFAKFLRFGSGPKDALMIDNAEWLTKLNYLDMLRDIGRHFSVNRMLAMDSVKLRLEREHELQEVLARIKSELCSGQPALLWHAFTNAEWDVVCGYDEEMGVFYGRGSYAGVDGYACEAQTRALTCLDVCPALGALILGEKESAGDLRAAEIAALREAVRHGRAVKQEGADGKWTFLEGLQCYERWVREFRDDPARGCTAGDSYCLSVMRSTHRAAAQFLREIAPAYPAGKRGLIRAANCFEAEAEALDACCPLLGWESPEEPEPRCNTVIADLLAHACDAYATGIASIEQALDGITKND